MGWCFPNLAVVWGGGAHCGLLQIPFPYVPYDPYVSYVPYVPYVVNNDLVET